MHDFVADYMVDCQTYSMCIYKQAVSCSVVSTIKDISFFIQYYHKIRHGWPLVKWIQNARYICSSQEPKFKV